MKIHFLNVRTMHHSPHSGYDRFMDYIPNTPLPPSRTWQRMSEEKRKLAYDDAKRHISWYNPPDLEMETNVNALNPWFSNHICHFLYGENSVYHIQKSRNPRKKIFVSFHQPPEAHQQFIRTREPLKNIDGVVVVATNQIPFFEKYVDRSKIHFVPHGVDTDFFRPDLSIEKCPNTVIFVGNWLRDFDTLVSVSQILAVRAPKLVLDVVTLERNKPLLEGCRNITFSSGISEDLLLQKYRQASLLIVPMKDCTANNSVLEGMSCGLPVVTSDIGGIRDYLDQTSAVLCQPADSEGMAETVISLLSAPNRLASMGSNARETAQRFAWPKVAEIMRAAYSKSFARVGD